jgi:catechol 2,3-dioxygenase-like lactoylglutathione lyase family enzyme
MPKAVLDHVAVAVSDMDSAIAFYTEKLGLSLMFRKLDEEHHEAFAFLEVEGGNLELLQQLDESNQPIPHPRPEIREPFCPHIALKTDDMDALLNQMEKAGVPIVKGPLEITDTVRWVYLSDPDHNILEFVQWL